MTYITYYINFLVTKMIHFWTIYHASRLLQNLNKDQKIWQQFTMAKIVGCLKCMCKGNIATGHYRQIQIQGKRKYNQIDQKYVQLTIICHFYNQIPQHSELGIGLKKWVPTKFPHFFWAHCTMKLGGIVGIDAQPDLSNNLNFNMKVGIY